MYDKRYTTKEHIKELYEKQGRAMKFTGETKEAYQNWKPVVRDKLRELLGIEMMESCESQQQLLEEVVFETYTRRKFIIQTEPNVWMPFYELIPNDRQEGEKRPVVIAPHGHGGGGKLSIAGDDRIPEIRSAIERYRYAYGVEFVKKGYVVYCPDARGAGERLEDITAEGNVGDLFKSSCNAINFAAMSLGQTLTGMMVWDLMRLIDWIEERSYCDSKRLSCVGFSGGGLQTLWLSVLEDRVQCAGISGYFYSIGSTILNAHQCGCNYVPNLWRYVDIGEIAALIAPRPLFIESGSRDSQNGEMGIESATQQAETVKAAYSLWGKEENFIHFIFDGVHEYRGKEILAFVDKHTKL